jgi:hypothetical protein
MHHLSRDFDLRRHVGEAEIHRLVFEDRLAETLAFVRVMQCRLEGRARHADGLRRDADAPAFEVGQRDAVALAFAAEQVFGGDAAVLEQDLRRIRSVLAELFLDAGDDVARRVCGHDEGRDALLAGARIGDGEDHGDLRVLARGDELLDAIEHPAVAIAHGLGPDRRGVGADMRLGQAEAAQPFAGRQLLQVFLLLRVRAEGVDRAADHRVLHADDGGRGAVAGGDFLQRQRQRNVIQAGAAPLLGHHHAAAAELAQRPQLLAREVRRAVPLRRPGGELLAREIAQHVADLFLFFAQDHL